MKTTIEYVCKFCRQKRFFETDIPADCPPLNIEKWRRMLVCNDCADHETDRRSVEAKIYTQAIAWKMAQHGLRNAADKLAPLEQKCRDNLDGLTKTFCRIVCARNHHPNEWEPQMTDFIMKRPDKFRDVLAKFRRGVSPHAAAV